MASSFLLNRSVVSINRKYGFNRCIYIISLQDKCILGKTVSFSSFSNSIAKSFDRYNCTRSHIFYNYFSKRILATSASYLAQTKPGNDAKPRRSVPFIHRFLPPKRDCFHPGTSIGLSRQPMSFGETKKVTNRDMITAMMSSVWPKDDVKIRQRVMIAVGLMVLTKLLNVSVPFIFKYGIDSLNVGLSIDTPTEALLTGATSLMISYGVFRACASGFNELRYAIFASVAQHSIRKIARNVFLHLHSLDLAFHLSRQTGALSKVIDRGSKGIQYALSSIVFNIVPTIFELALVSSILAWRCGSDFAAVAVSCVGLYSVFTLLITRWRTKIRHDMNDAENDASNKAIDSLINYETVKYFNNEKFEADRYDEALKTYEAANLKISTSLALLNFGQNLIFSSALSVIMVLAVREIVAGNMTVGDLVMVNGLLFQLSVPLGFLGSVYREIRQSLVDTQTMFQLMSKDPSIKNKTGASFLNVAPDTANIEFRNVFFQYEEGKPILQNLSFKIPAGKKVAIVGGSGSGKSSVIRLLYRFFEPDSGEILINGQNIRDVDIDSLRRSIAVVPQDSVLFHNTIFYNLHYGNLQKTKEEVYEASRMADLHDSVLQWPKGYETKVGERGLKLSGGEKQRVAIARAVLKDAPILVFDEATSSLDSITERNILDALTRATANRTSICVAHRLSTVMDASEILVLDKGKVAERGTHAELIANLNSLYAQLWEKQQFQIPTPGA